MIDEGYIKFDIDWVEDEAPSAEAIATLNHWRSILFDAGLVGYSAEHDVGYGNLSERLSGLEFLITGTQTGHIARTSPEHYCRVVDFDIDGNTVRCRGPLKASSESMTHAAIYAQNEAVRAVVHVHDETLWEWALDRIPSTPADIAYGTPAMARDLQRLVAAPDFEGLVVMAGHAGGLIAVGDGVAQAAERVLRLREQSGRSASG